MDKISSTSIATLYCKANKGDDYARQVIDNFPKEWVYGNLSKYTFPPIIIRTNLFDEIVISFINENPHSTILNIGCGFCTRYQRIEAHKTPVKWVNLDYSESIDILRNTFPETEKLSYVKQNLNKDFDIKYDLLIAEGALPYLEVGRARELVKGRVLFDVIGSKNGAKAPIFKWAYIEEDWSFKNILRYEKDYTIKGRDDRLLYVEN